MVETYIIKLECIRLPDGRILYKKDVIAAPDNETEIMQSDSNLPLRDLTDEELNEIMEEIAYEKTIDADPYPLKSIRHAVCRN